MAGTTSKGSPTRANTDAASFADDLTAVSQWASDHIGESVANAAALPSSGNWVNRTIMAADTFAVYVWVGSWKCTFQPLTAYTPTLTGITLGSGGSILGAWSRAGATVTWRAMVTLGSSGFAVSDTFIGLPLAVASSMALSNVTVLGDALFADVSAGGAGRLRGAAVMGSANTNARIVQSTSFLSIVNSTSPFTWAAGDQIQVNGTYLTDVN